MRILTMYLPQYHRVKENDKWWGKGYTDWVSARNSRPLYEGHYQPHIPKDHYYYDLMNKKTMEWQADLMKKYGIDGQCIYHYWFKDGRKILEKPVENLLKWTDINMPFCFCWANQSWANSWSAVKNVTVWCDDREQQKKGDGTGLLLEQSYGDREDWVHHFNYLLPFFRDPRYIKHKGKPVLVIHLARNIDVLDKMRECWNNLAQKEGFDGIYLIGANNQDMSLVDDVLYPGPQNGMVFKENMDTQLRRFDYRDVWENLIQMAMTEENRMVGAFVGYDDTPRRGLRGCVIEGSAPELFQRYLTDLIAINDFHGKPYTFINAWNEWGEGMHLEPDEKNGFRYLEAVLVAKERYREVVSGMQLSIKRDNALFSHKKIIERYSSYWRILDKWIYLKEMGLDISDILRKRAISSVIIYGIGMLGKHLIHDLKGSNVEIVGGIDQKVANTGIGFPVYTLDDQKIEADIVIVTACYEYSDIKKQLSAKGYNNITSLQEILDSEI